MDALTKSELESLYSLAVQELNTQKELVSNDERAYKRFVNYWDKLADKLRVLSEEA
jgi:hypothetical protein